MLSLVMLLKRILVAIRMLSTVLFAGQGVNRDGEEEESGETKTWKTSLMTCYFAFEQ